MLPYFFYLNYFTHYRIYFFSCFIMDCNESFEAHLPSQSDQINSGTEAPSGYGLPKKPKLKVHMDFEEAKTSFFTAQYKFKQEITNEENEVSKRICQLVSGAGAALRDELLAHDSFVKQIYSKLHPEKLRLAHLQETLTTMKANCTTKGTISAGALDEVADLGKSIQKQTDFLTKLEGSCDKQIKAENARYYQKRSELWMEILPDVEQLEGSKKEFYNSRFCELQNMAQAMNRARKSLQVGANQEKTDHYDVNHMFEEDKENKDDSLVGTRQNEADDDIIELAEGLDADEEKRQEEYVGTLSNKKDDDILEIQ